MKTAVEWLIENHFGAIQNCTPDFRNKINQAIEMEKEQIIEAYIDRIKDTYQNRIEAEQYYNQTFKKS